MLLATCGEEADTPTASGADASVVDTATTPDAPNDMAAAVTTDAGCLFAAQCPSASKACEQATCIDGACGLKAVPAGHPCDDGDPCTVDDHCVAGGCEAGPDLCECSKTSDCATYDDGNPCNGTMYCDDGKIPRRCAFDPLSPVHCAPATTMCMQNVCNPATGECETTARVDGTPCNDADPCTVESACKGGACVAAQANWCACQTAADCAALNSGNPCAGIHICDTAVFPWKCVINPSSLPDCQGPGGDPCLVNACVDKDGKGACADMAIELAEPVCQQVGGEQLCRWLALPDGKSNKPPTCDDGESCTTGDACVAGKCVPGTDVCKCLDDAACAKFEDGNKCNGTLFCDMKSGECLVNPGTLITCPSADDGPCLKNHCQPQDGSCAMAKELDGTACDDGQLCTDSSACKDGACGGGKNICLCKTDADCVDKDDGDMCNGLPFCNKSKGACEIDPTKVVVCQIVEDTACLKNACQPKTGQCAVLPIAQTKQVCGKVGAADLCRWVVKPPGEATDTAVSCDEEGDCTVGDHCDGGACVKGPKVCDCLTNADCAAKEDGDLCNGTMYCDKIANPPTCKLNPATVIKCQTVDDDACNQRKCDPKTAQCPLLPINELGKCDDGNPCTDGDTCKVGKCVPGTFKCGCTIDADCAKLEDNDKCNGTLYCHKAEQPWACKPLPNSAVICPKSAKGCVDIGCEKDSGKCVEVQAASGSPCSDGSACTAEDTCKQGLCVGSPVACDDKNVCTKDSCDPSLGCVHALADGTPCLSTVPCAAGGICGDGQCKPGGPRLYKKVWGDAGLEEGLSVAADVGDGGLWLAGFRATAGATGDEVWLVRAGGSGKVIEEILHGGPGDQRAMALFAMADGGALIAGYNQPAAGPSAGLLARFDEAGKPLWSQSLKSPLAGAAGLADAVTDTGGFAACGTAAKRCWLVSTDAKGALAWQSTWGDGVFESRCDALVRAGDGYGLAGWSEQAGDALLLRSDAQGSKLWSRTLGGDGNDAAFDLVALPDGGFALAGTTGTGKALWLARTDVMGQLKWQRSLVPTSGAHGGGGLLALADGGLALAGWLESGQTGQGADAILLRTDGLGDVLWSRIWAGKGHQRYLGLTTVVGGDLVAVGGDGGQALLARLDAWGHEDCGELGLCAYKQLADCDDANPCTADLCSAKDNVGCVHKAASGSPCADGDACTLADTCAEGQCKGTVCDDGNPCTDGKCQPGVGCAFTANDAKCDDGDTCTEPDACKGGKCAGGSESKGCCYTADKCDDGNACTVDSCDAGLHQCLHAFAATQGQPCNADGDGCTEKDTCNLGACAAGEAVDCSGSADTCNLAACKTVGATGHQCYGKPKSKDTPCDDGSGCTVGEICNGIGGCVGGKPNLCDDFQDCTVDSCDGKSGQCVHSAKADGAPCDDGELCTDGDACKAGACLGAQACPDMRLDRGLPMVSCCGDPPTPSRAVGLPGGRFAVAWRSYDKAVSQTFSWHLAREQINHVSPKLNSPNWFSWPAPPLTALFRGLEVMGDQGGHDAVQWGSNADWSSCDNKCKLALGGSNIIPCPFGCGSSVKVSRAAGQVAWTSVLANGLAAAGGERRALQTWAKYSESTPATSFYAPFPAGADFGVLDVAGVALANGNRLIAVQFRTVWPGDPDVWVRLFSADGAVIKDVEKVSGFSQLRLAACADGRAILVGMQGGHVKGRIWTQDGGPDSDVFAVSKGGLKRGAPAVATTPQGRYVVAWEHDDQIAVQLFHNTPGTKKGPQVIIAPNAKAPRHTPTIGTFEDGSYVVAWSDDGGMDGDGSAIVGQWFAADGAAVGPLRVLNATATYDQLMPWAASMSGIPEVPGGVVTMIWVRRNKLKMADTPLFGRSFDSKGHALRGPLEALVNTTTKGDQADPSIAASVDGSHLVVWTTPNKDASGAAIAGRRFLANGAPAGGELLLNTHTKDDQMRPQVSAVPAGGYVVVWQSIDQDGDGWGVYGQRLDAKAAPTGLEMALNQHTKSQQQRPDVAALANGGFAAAWEGFEQPGGQDWDIVLRCFDKDNKAVGNELVANSSTAKRQEWASVAAAGAGAVVAWHSFGQDADDSTGISAQRFDGACKKAGPELVVHSKTKGDQREPAVAGDDKGGFIVVWKTVDGVNGLDIGAQRFDKDGQKVGGEFLANLSTPDSQDAPALALWSDGEAVVTWRSWEAYVSRWGVRSVRIGLKGHGQPDMVVNRFDSGQNGRPAVATLKDGRYVVVWESTTADSDDLGLAVRTLR